MVTALKKSLAQDPGPVEQRRSRLLFEEWVAGARTRARSRSKMRARAAGRSGVGAEKEEEEEVEILELELIQLEEKEHRDNLMTLMRSPSTSPRSSREASQPSSTCSSPRCLDAHVTGSGEVHTPGEPRLM